MLSHFDVLKDSYFYFVSHLSLWNCLPYDTVTVFTLQLIGEKSVSNLFK